MVSTSILKRWRKRALLGDDATAISLAAVSGYAADAEEGAYGDADQARDRAARRELQLRSSLRHLRAAERRQRLEPAVEGDHQGDGTPGPCFTLAQQFQTTPSFQTTYFISLDNSQKTPYVTLPLPGLNFSPTTNEDVNTFAANGVVPPFLATTPLATLAALEPSLEADDLALLTTGANGLCEPPPFNLADEPIAGIANFNTLANGPFPLRGTKLPFDSYTGDTTHRLFEMWQQSDCSVANSTRTNPSGCLNDLYPFVITNYTGPTDNGGSNSMAFYNVQLGDAPVLKKLADEFAMSDNYHQAGEGGTAIQHIYIGSGDGIFWSDGNGTATIPPSHLANPNPLSGTNESTSSTPISTATSRTAPISRSPGSRRSSTTSRSCLTPRARNATLIIST